MARVVRYMPILIVLIPYDLVKYLIEKVVG